LVVVFVPQFNQNKITPGELERGAIFTSGDLSDRFVI